MPLVIVANCFVQGVELQEQGLPLPCGQESDALLAVFAGNLILFFFRHILGNVQLMSFRNSGQLSSRVQDEEGLGRLRMHPLVHQTERQVYFCDN